MFTSGSSGLHFLVLTDLRASIAPSIVEEPPPVTLRGAVSHRQLRSCPETNIPGREPCSCIPPAQRLSPWAHHSRAGTAPHSHLRRQLGGRCTGKCRQSAHGIICPPVPVAVLAMLILKIAHAWENFVRHVCHSSSTPFPKHEKSSLMPRPCMRICFFSKHCIYISSLRKYN